MKNLENKSSAQNKLFKAIAEEPPSKKSCCSDISIVKDPMMMTGNTIGQKQEIIHLLKLLLGTKSKPVIREKLKENTDPFLRSTSNLHKKAKIDRLKRAERSEVESEVLRNILNEKLTPINFELSLTQAGVILSANKMKLQTV